MNVRIGIHPGISLVFMLGGGHDGDDKFTLDEKWKGIAAKTDNYCAVYGAGNFRSCGGLHVARKHLSSGTAGPGFERGDYVPGLPRRVD